MGLRLASALEMATGPHQAQKIEAAILEADLAINEMRTTVFETCRLETCCPSDLPTRWVQTVATLTTYQAWSAWPPPSGALSSRAPGRRRGRPGPGNQG